MKTNLTLLATAIVALTILASCNKTEDQPLNNLKHFRNDPSQAEIFTESTLNTDRVLLDRVNGVDYIIPGKMDLKANLTIQPGVTIMFEEGAGIYVRKEGSLTAIGEKGNEIYFTSRSGRRGSWTGLVFLSTSAKNVLEHTLVEQAGAENGYATGNIVIGAGDDHGSVVITNSEITASKTVGIRMAPGSAIKGFTGNNIHTNTDFGLSMYVVDASLLTDENTFSNNGKEYVQIQSFSEIVMAPIRLNPLRIPYLVSDRISTSADFTIEPGTRVVMDNGAGILINGLTGAGTFTAVGTATSPITIQGVYNSASPGTWNAIRFNSSNSAKNRIENCVITGGGASAEDKGMISVINQNGGTSTVVIRNNNISNSAGYGIYLKAPNAQCNADIQSANTFGTNVKGNVMFEYE